MFKCVNAITADRGIHLDHVASKLTCYTGTEITAAKNIIFGGSVMFPCEFASDRRLIYCHSSQHSGSEAEADDIRRTKIVPFLDHPVYIDSGAHGSVSELK